MRGLDSSALQGAGLSLPTAERLLRMAAERVAAQKAAEEAAAVQRAEEERAAAKLAATLEVLTHAEVRQLGLDQGEVTVPDKFGSIGAGAFSSCSSLASITLPEGLTSIGVSAFKGCSSLTSITLPEGLTLTGGEGIPATTVHHIRSQGR